MSKFFKILGMVFTVLFIYAAVVQYNDPDALLWCAIYGLAALASILFSMDRLNLLSAVVLTIGCFIGVFVSWPEQYEGIVIGEGNIVNIEKGREALGLLIVAVAMLVYALRIVYVGKRKAKS
ncbi:MAG: hypothetical protein COA50_14575 [Flavobacteriaceae bacterium]|nr:MAG: hypothetical protein COA50_14575 [Flavobacteriaceae bacterium]